MNSGVILKGSQGINRNRLSIEPHLKNMKRSKWLCKIWVTIPGNFKQILSTDWNLSHEESIWWGRLIKSSDSAETEPVASSTFLQYNSSVITSGRPVSNLFFPLSVPSLRLAELHVITEELAQMITGFSSMFNRPVRKQTHFQAIITLEKHKIRLLCFHVSMVWLILACLGCHVWLSVDKT